MSRFNSTATYRTPKNIELKVEFGVASRNIFKATELSKRIIEQNYTTFFNASKGQYDLKVEFVK